MGPRDDNAGLLGGGGNILSVAVSLQSIPSGFVNFFPSGV